MGHQCPEILATFQKWIAMKKNLWPLSLFPCPQLVVPAKWGEKSQSTSCLIESCCNQRDMVTWRHEQGMLEPEQKRVFIILFLSAHPPVTLNEHGKVILWKTKPVAATVPINQMAKLVHPTFGCPNCNFEGLWSLLERVNRKLNQNECWLH